MVIDIFGGEKANIPYLMSNSTAIVLRGDPAITESVITHLDFGQRFCSGCMSFNEPLSIEKAIQHIDEFEAPIGAGFPKGALNTLWIRHTDKGRTELHFLIPQVNLLTGRQVTIYFDARDRRLMNGIRDVINVREGYTRPDDPARKRTTSVPLRAAQKKKDFMMNLDIQIGSEVAAGRVKNRDDIVRYLESEGLIVRRSKKGKLPDEYLKVRRPHEEKFTGLRGAYYRTDYVTSHGQPVVAEPTVSRDQELEEAKARLQLEVKRRARRQNERHEMALRAEERRTKQREKDAPATQQIAAEIVPSLPPKSNATLKPQPLQQITHDKHRITDPFSGIIAETGSFASRASAWFDRATKTVSRLVDSLYKSGERTESGTESLGDLGKAVDACRGRFLGALGKLDHALGRFEDEDGGDGGIVQTRPFRRPPTSPTVSGRRL